MKWSDDQKNAIDTSIKRTLISAGAGSGKTAVLTQRLVDKITNGTEVKNLIILTFTILAASEMKERLRKELIKSDDAKCKEQLAYIDAANICTFDSFTNSIVRKYHYLLNMPSKFNIGSATDFKMVSNKILKDIFNEYYEKEDPAFLTFVDTYCVKDDDELIKYFIKSYNKMKENPAYLSNLNNYEKYYDKDYMQSLVDDFCKQLKTVISDLDTYLERLREYTTDPITEEHYQNVCEQMQYFHTANTYEELSYIGNIKFPTFYKKKVEDPEVSKGYEKIYEGLKKQIGKIKEKYIDYQNTDEMIQEYLATKDQTDVIVEIMKEFDRRLKQYKKENNVYDFNDIALKAIEILENNPDIIAEMKQTNEILVDEYQDTSDIQERLVDLISNNNVYMVGDIKQSIYGFRNANPAIFQKTYNSLKVVPYKLKKDKSLINLLENFRSRKEVLSAVNLIFSQIMSENIGGVEYDESHRLNFGFKDYNDINDENYDMVVMTYPQSCKSEDDDSDENYEEEEVEAFAIAKDILEKVGKFKVYHKDDKTYSPAKFSDFAILVSKKKNMDLYAKVFNYFGIPIKLHQQIDIAVNNDYLAIVSLLKLIYTFDDYKYCQENIKEVLTSVIRSFIIGLDDESIFKIISSDNIDKAFKESLPELYEQCEKTSKVIKTMNLSESMDYIFKTFNIYEKMLILDNLNEVEFRLNYFYQIMQNLTNLNYTYKDMLDYFDFIAEEDDNEIKIDTPQFKQSDAVIMMSIHASKGLEFPICYFPQLYGEFNDGDSKDALLYSKEYQFIPRYQKDKLLKKILPYYLEREKASIEKISEQIRLFYVALTRAREKIIMLLPVDEKATLNDTSEANKKKYNSFKDFLYSIDNSLEPYKHPIELKELGLTKEYIYGKKPKDEELSGEKLVFNDIKLEKVEKTKSIASTEKVGYFTKDDLEKLKVGTRIHKLLELMDFDNPKFDNLTPKDQKMIKAFFDQPFIKELKIINHYHEYNFMYMDNDKEINGIIDLILETDDAYYIIDYKLYNLDKAEYTKQLGIYRTFLSSITEKKVYTYLYSIIKNTFLEVI